MGKKKYDYDEMEEELSEAHEESKNRKDSYGKFGTIFKDDIGAPIWKCDKGEHTLDIIPYFAGKHDPNRPEGKSAYFLDIFVHKNVGASGERVICPSKNYKKRCPICEEMKRLSDKGVEWDEIKHDSAVRTNVYNVVCLDSRDEIKKGVQVWSIANFFMEDKLRAIAKSKKTGEPIYYASPKKETGRSISFEYVKKAKGKVEYLGHSFEKRDEDIPRDLLEQAVCLDEAVILMDFEAIYELYWDKPYNKKNERGRKAIDEDDDEEESTRKKKHKDDDDEEETPRKKKKDKDEELECPAKNGTFGEDCDELRECKKCEVYDECSKEHDRIEDEELEDKPKSKKKKKDEDDDDDDDEPKSKKKKKSDDDDDD